MILQFSKYNPYKYICHYILLNLYNLQLELPIAITARGTKITTPESKCPELLANYCDMLLRRTPLSKRLTSEQIELRLKDVLLVLKYVSNKDVFMRYHKVHLTRRLILDSSADSEKEEDMVEWLREVGMPADYVNKLARMFQDIKVDTLACSHNFVKVIHPTSRSAKI